MDDLGVAGLCADLLGSYRIKISITRITTAKTALRVWWFWAVTG